MAGRAGPDGCELFVDVAELRYDEQPNLILIVSGTHGVEGFCGSGCQVGFLLEKVYQGLPKDVGVALVHALNPYGFAWERRVNENNVDINRNFHDFTKQLPPSGAYEAVHDLLVPADWDGPARQKADSEIQSYLESRGLATFQAAVSGGQYSRADGLFFGGTQETWSNKTFKQIMSRLLTGSVRQLAVLDLHTGLGPSGYGEPIYIGADIGEYFRAIKWYGPELTSTARGDLSSAQVSGNLGDGLRGCVETVRSTIIAVEYGTVAVIQVLTALRADNWLHASNGASNSLRDAIKRQIRDAFYVDETWWKAAVYGRSVDMILRAGRGLASA